MNQPAFEFGEFIESKENSSGDEIPITDEKPVDCNVGELDDISEVIENIDVQKAVVESLAADKAQLGCELDAVKKTLFEKEKDISSKDREIDALKEELSKKDFEIAYLKVEIAKKESQLAKAVEKSFDTQERNPNALALLDREVELPDRFPGETRDHVIEAVREARDRAESEGRRRRAQILESVLVANEPNGTLAERRAELGKLFSENNNLINGTVIEKLADFSLSHKEGGDYLLASEILLRNF